MQSSSTLIYTIGLCEPFMPLLRALDTSLYSMA